MLALIIYIIYSKDPIFNAYHSKKITRENWKKIEIIHKTIEIQLNVQTSRMKTL